ncbi:MAG: DUF4389 domain-containing protein [Betaproteobacteria bacterium]
MENENSVEQAGNETRWVRALYMILFAVLFKAAEFVMWVVVVIQLAITLATGGPNERLQRFGKQLSIYVYSLWMFLTYNTEKKPFPFSDWPTYGTGVSPAP